MAYGNREIVTMTIIWNLGFKELKTWYSFINLFFYSSTRDVSISATLHNDKSENNDKHAAPIKILSTDNLRN